MHHNRRASLFTRWLLFRHQAAFCIAGLSIVAFGVSIATAEDAVRPNIVLILADDLGYGDVQCYNPTRSKIPTPHIDQLAREGMRFTDAHSSSGVCSPSRYTLLTGRYHWRTRLQAGIVGYLERPLIAADRLTLGSLLQQQGYHTACVGKWHLGWDWDIPKEERPLFAPGRGNFPAVTASHLHAWQARFRREIAGGPTTRGFNEYFGTDVPNWPPYCFIEGNKTVGIPSTFLPEELFQNHLASLPGPALEGWRLESVLPALGDRACRYIEEQARSEQPFFLYLPLTSPHTPLAVNERWRGKSQLNSAVADLIMETDNVVGRVLQAIWQQGVEQNTLVLFTSDNGFAPYVGAKHLEEQGHFPSGPWRGYKGDVWEGGHRVAFAAKWPSVISHGSQCEQLIHHADVMATVAAIVGVSLPANAGEDSVSLLPLLQGGRDPVREHAISQGSRGMLALRNGNWKLILGPDGGGAWSHLSATEPDGMPAQLYNLAIDQGETTNLFRQKEATAQEMMRLIENLVTDGRSTPGTPQQNDVTVNWRRFMPTQGAK